MQQRNSTRRGTGAEERHGHRRRKPQHQQQPKHVRIGGKERDGLLVRGVVEGSPAATAGVQRGDLLVRAGERQLAGMDDLFDALDAAGDTLTVTLLRGTEERELDVPLRSG